MGVTVYSILEVQVVPSSLSTVNAGTSYPVNVLLSDRAALDLKNKFILNIKYLNASVFLLTVNNINIQSNYV